MSISGNPECRILDIVTSAGASRVRTFRIYDSSGSAVTGFVEVNELLVDVWPGDDYEPLTGTGLSAEWDDASIGSVRIIADGTHTIPPKKYHWRVRVDTLFGVYEIARGSYDVLPSPGSRSNDADVETDPYTTIDDLRTVFRGIDAIQGATDQAGLAEHQRAARTWFDDCVKAGYVNGNVYYPQSFVSYVPVDDVPQWLTDVLATGSGIELTPKVKRACACYACYSALMGEITATDEGNVYRRMAASFREEAANLVASMTVNVKASTTATDYAVRIHMNRATRR